MQSKAKTVDDYLAELPEDRRNALEKIRAVFKKNLDRKIVEHMNYGMVGYSVPHSVYPPGYHCDPKQPLPFAGMASQKNHMALYLFGMYLGGPDLKEFQAAWRKSGKRLDMGKSCVRFKRIEDVPLDVVGAAIKKMTLRRFLGIYEESLAATGTRKAAKKGAKKPAARKKAAKK